MQAYSLSVVQHLRGLVSDGCARSSQSPSVTYSDLKRYESEATARKEAWLVGVADPTDGQIPEGRVFVSHGSEKRRFEVLVRVVQCYSAWRLMKL